MASRVFTRALARAVVPTATRFVAPRSVPLISASMRSVTALPAYRPYSSSSSKEELLDALTEELKYEQDQLVEKKWTSMPKELADVLRSTGYKLIDEADSDVITIQRKQGNIDILIKWSASDVHHAMSENFEQTEEEDEFDDFGPNDNSFPVKVFVTKEGAGTLVIEASAEDNSLVYEQILHFSDSNMAVSELADDELKKRSSYWGPPFADLDERLQQTLIDHFEDLGITNEITPFIYEYSEFKEAQLYAQHLKNLRSFFAA
ncbi:mitochondrial glycoprotein [Myxozyma melibiosi]|uniref:Mitochondrial glycoprotein n=1 Tax=Myxozyma melibiosi TaxID=54550 RepID=A0ABR1F9V1_9ASCO